MMQWIRTWLVQIPVIAKRWLKPIQATSPEHLYALVDECIVQYGPKCPLNHIDVSQVTHMEGLFRNRHFLGDISQWDVSKVANMQAMFRSSAFNQDISGWNPLHVSYFNEMFEESAYAHPLFLITPHPLQHGRALKECCIEARPCGLLSR